MTAPLWSKPGLRGRLLLSVLVALALVLAALTFAFNVVLADRLDSDASGVAQARASGELASLAVVHGRIVLPEAPDERNRDAPVWVFEGSKPLERPLVPGGNDRVAALLALAAPAARDVPATGTRLYSLPVVQGGRMRGAVIAGVSLAPYQGIRQTALLASVALALTVFLAVALAAHWVIARALRPVAQMTRQAADWSDHELDRRFDLGSPHDELTELAATLDRLLDRLAGSLRHEQRLSAELSHELRTPLASVSAEAQYALRHTRQTEDGRAVLERILDRTSQMSRTLDTLIAAARAQLDPRRATSDPTAGVAAAIDATDSLRAALDIAVRIEPPPESVRVAVELGLVERILAPVIENAYRHATESVQITVEREGTAVLLTIEDDGPGVPVDEREAIFEPGRRSGTATATTLAATGAGLGLALSRRLARSAGGDVEAAQSDDGGRFVVRLPAA